MGSLIEYHNVSFTYDDGTKALQNFSAALEQGQKIAFLGSNGSGKTTTFLLMNGLLKPSQGQIAYAGKPFSYHPKDLHELRKNISIVFHDPEIQIFANSVFEEISFGPKNLDLDDADIRKRVEYALDVCDIADLRRKPPHFLSFGQKRLVTIASVLAMESNVLVLDEPTSGLDGTHAQAIIQILKTLSAQGKTIVFSTHDADLAFELADAGYILNHGQCVKHGAIETLFNDHQCLDEAHIAVPYVLDMYNLMVEKNLLTPQASPPRTWPEFKALMQSEEGTHPPAPSLGKRRGARAIAGSIAESPPLFPREGVGGEFVNEIV